MFLQMHGAHSRLESGLAQIVEETEQSSAADLRELPHQNIEARPRQFARMLSSAGKVVCKMLCPFRRTRVDVAPLVMTVPLECLHLASNKIRAAEYII